MNYKNILFDFYSDFFAACRWAFTSLCCSALIVFLFFCPGLLPLGFPVGTYGGFFRWSGTLGRFAVGALFFLPSSFFTESPSVLAIFVCFCLFWNWTVAGVDTKNVSFCRNIPTGQLLEFSLSFFYHGLELILSGTMVRIKYGYNVRQYNKETVNHY